MFVQSGRPVTSASSLSPPFVLLPMPMTVVAVVTPDRMPVMVGKNKYDRRRNAYVHMGLDFDRCHYPCMSAAMPVHDTAGSKNRGEKQQGRQLTSQLQRELRFHWQSNISSRRVGFS